MGWFPTEKGSQVGFPAFFQKMGPFIHLASSRQKGFSNHQAIHWFPGTLEYCGNDFTRATDGNLQFIAVRSSSCILRWCCFETKNPGKKASSRDKLAIPTWLIRKKHETTTPSSPSSTYYFTTKNIWPKWLPPWPGLGSPWGHHRVTFTGGVPGGHDERYCKLGCAETHARRGKERALVVNDSGHSLEWWRGDGGRWGRTNPFKLAGKKDGTKVGKGEVCLTFGIIIFLTSKRGNHSQIHGRVVRLCIPLRMIFGPRIGH